MINKKRLEDGKFGVRIRLHLRRRFFREKNPNKLINNLLEKYYTPTNTHTHQQGYNPDKDLI